MHAYQRAARRVAWKDPHDQGAFNPFAQHFPGRRPRLSSDAEEAVQGRPTGAPDTTTETSEEKLGEGDNPPSAGAVSHLAQGDASDSAAANTLSQPVADVEYTETMKFRRRVHPLARRKPQRKSGLKLLQARFSFTLASQARLLLFNSWLHLLFLFVPADFAVNYCHVDPIAVFCVNFVAIVPSAMALSIAVDDLSLRIGNVLEGILSMTFSNAVQLITSILLLKARQIDVLKTSLIGTVLSNLLLMVGLAFLVGGYSRIEQHYNVAVAQLLGSLLLLAFLSLLVPTASSLLSNISPANLVRQSRGAAFMLLLSYGLWLLFQLKTHTEIFQKPSEKVEKRAGVVQAASKIGAAALFAEDERDEEDTPKLSPWIAVGAIIVATVLIAFNTQFATESINGLLDQAGLSSTFVGLVILPLLNNDPTMLKTAYKDKSDLSIALTIGKCMQTTLMVIPLIIIIAWPMGVEEMTLSFDSFEIVSLFASILIVNYIIQEGKSNWIQGALLVEAYIIISIAAYYVP